ncbi:superoxide dismutase [Cu-Zn] B-like [Liolophura sinensis]|uniref:superoxide dismutase [Cu-Zn] B-like n=1 Tax=Liolophura sinensis TaxID=3198878 RepID=UPI003158A17A
MREYLLVATAVVFLHTSSGQLRNQCRCFPGSDMFYEYATCRLTPNPGMEMGQNVHGVVRMRQRSCNWCKEAVEISVTVSGLQPSEGVIKNKHGFHVHEFGDLSGGCASAGGHYNPLNKNHAAPNSTVRHVGDLGNVMDTGSGTINEYFRDEVVSITGNIGVLGRSMVLHERADDLGKGGDAESLKTGNAGGRLACCVIGRATNTSWVQPTVPLSRRNDSPPQNCSWLIRRWFPQMCNGAVLVGDF